jgi:ribosome biogenesis protein Nip4
MLNFFKKNAALIWARKHVQKAEEFKKNAEKDQEKLLLSVNTAQKTLFGREHDFENIRSVKDFQDRVPLPTMKI